MKSLGADDNFLMLCAGPHNRAVQPSTGRKLQAGDIILAEITPSVRGQLAQICRTAVVGPASDELARKYALVVEAMDHGIAAAVPGVAMSEVCRAINGVLEAEGYGEYCHPPHIRRRGHGLGFASVRPGDVALDNTTVLEPDMVFMIHPNQYLPETGYLLCGEPVVMTAQGAEPLTTQKAALARGGLMLTAHPTLLIGPADWQPERMPETEFSARIETLWRSVPQAARAIRLRHAAASCRACLPDQSRPQA